MLENPFKPTRPESDTDPTANAQLVGEFLGPEAQAAYEKLDQGQAGKKGDDRSDLTLTDAEKNVVKEAREKEVWDRDRYIEWAASLGKDEKWVDETFSFHDDGTVECWYLDLDDITELHEFPQDLKISAELYLQNLTSAQGLTLPTEIGGDLWLRNLTSAQGLTLPTEIGGDLWLRNLTSAEGLIIPENFFVEGDVYTNSTLRPFFDKLKGVGKIRGDIIVR